MKEAEFRSLGQLKAWFSLLSRGDKKAHGKYFNAQKKLLEGPRPTARAKIGAEPRRWIRENVDKVAAYTHEAFGSPRACKSRYTILEIVEPATPDAVERASADFDLAISDGNLVRRHVITIENDFDALPPRSNPGKA